MTLAHATQLAAGCATMPAFGHVPQPIALFAGTTSITTCGSSALPRTPRLLLPARSHAPTTNHLADPALTVGDCITIRTIAPSIPFEVLSVLPPLPLLYPDIALVEDTPTPQGLPPPPPLPAPPTSPAPLGPYVGSSTVPRVNATSAVSSTPAAAPPMGRGTAGIRPIPQPHISQHRLVTPLRPLELQHELAPHPDKGFVSELLASITHGCNIGYEGPHFPHTPFSLFTHPGHQRVPGEGVHGQSNGWSVPLPTPT